MPLDDVHQSLGKKSLKALKKETLYSQLLNSINYQFEGGTQDVSILDFVQSIKLDGKPFSFKRHEYLWLPYQETHSFQVESKATQMGLTTKAILRATHAARFRNIKGIMYLWPSRSDSSDFTKSRIDPLIQENPDTLGIWIKETDSANIKKIWNAFLYIRGMKSRSGLKSVPIDLLIFDELDEAPQNMTDLAMERMSHSEFRETLKLSNPTYPDFGISKEFDETDQRYWLLKCPSCGEYVCLEDTFPDCLQEINGRVIRACSRCKAELNPAIGEWVAKRPSIIDKRGYHYSQLFSQFVDPSEILRQYRTTTNLQDFWNLKIGVPWVDAQNRLTTQEVLSHCGDHAIQNQDAGACFMGVDQGKDLHVVIGKRDSEKSKKIVHLGIYKDWSDLDPLMSSFKVACCVCDGMPETRNARAFAERHGGRVYLNYYNEHQKGSYAWNDKELIVSCNRTESLDSSHFPITSGEITLPRASELTKIFALHLHNVAKKLEEDEETGSKRYVYVKLGPDHFRHSFNYALMASGQVGLAKSREEVEKEKLFRSLGLQEKEEGPSYDVLHYGMGSNDYNPLQDL